MAGIFSKGELRQRILAERRALSAAEREGRSTGAQEALAGSSLFERARTVALYRGLPSEVATGLLLERAQAAGKRVAFPRVTSEGEMAWCVLGLDSRFVRHPLGFEQLEGATEIALAELDLIVVPGVAFDRRGHRLGFGKGHYDRALSSSHSRQVLVGLAFDLQLVDEVPAERHDVHMDWLATEAGLVACPTDEIDLSLT